MSPAETTSGDPSPGPSWWPRLLGRLGVAPEGEPSAAPDTSGDSGEEPRRRDGGGIEPHPPSLAPDSAHLQAALRTLELSVRRRLDGLLQGNHLGLVPGPGSEAGDADRKSVV